MRRRASLRRVVLVTGTKYYGSHLGPFKTPARESDPRHMPPNYYFDQIDWLTGFPARQELGLGGAAAADAVRLCAGHADESCSRHRGLCRGQQGARLAVALSRQAGSVCVDLPGHRVHALRQRRVVGGHRAALRAAKRSTSPTATISGGGICGRSSPRPSTCRSAIRRRSASRQHMADKEPLWRAMTAKYAAQALCL